MKRTVFLSAGHSNEIGRDRGAAATHSGQLWIEGVEAVRMRDAIAGHLRAAGVKIVTDNNRNVIAETLRLFRASVTPNCIVVDIHFNAATRPANGTETLIPEVPTNFERRLAGEINQALVDIGFRNRGVKTEADSHHGRLGWMRLNGENILIETCFISNAEDMNRYQRHFNIICKSIADVLIKNATT